MAKQKNVAKPVFNNDGKLLYSKFDIANVGKKDKTNKVQKDPKKILMYLKQQEGKIKLLEEKEDGDKAKFIKEKIAWKNVLRKAEGQKLKDDPILLKKSIKKVLDNKRKNTVRNSGTQELKTLNNTKKKDKRKGKRILPRKRKEI